MQKKVKIHLIIGARPNIMKIAPLYHALKREPWAKPVIIHTGQHYDLNMSKSFFKDLRLPNPLINLGVGSGSHARQIWRALAAYEKVLRSQKPGLVVVSGDVNSTVACALAAVKSGFKTAHLEAGLRSFDLQMPEEINRMVTDSVCDILWTPSPDADKNLLREGISKSKIKFVGNIMIDSIRLLRPGIIKDETYRRMRLKERGFGIVTLHRPSNVDSFEKLRSVCKILKYLAKDSPIVFPMHPRTKNSLLKHNLLPTLSRIPNLYIREPLPYLKFMNLLFYSRFALTDSGGIQEETTYLGVPCLTLRENTERPITITQGSNKLTDLNHCLIDVQSVLKNSCAKKRIPKFWDGNTSKRIVDSLRSFFGIA